jgi:hypothetical protein
MSIEEYKTLIKTRKTLLVLASIQSLGLDSSLVGLKDVNVKGFSLAFLVKKMLI